MMFAGSIVDSSVLNEKNSRWLRKKGGGALMFVAVSSSIEG